MRVVAIAFASLSLLEGVVGEPGEPAGGALTVVDASAEAYGQPAPELDEAASADFLVGNSFFNRAWVAAPASVTDRDGLGPLFNARSCSACHLHDGRGRPPEPGQAMVSMLVRISVVDGHGVRPDPMYGDQIQNRAIPGFTAEAEPIVQYDVVAGHYGDGDPYWLRRPRLRLIDLGYGPPAPGLVMSARVAPAVFGLGLLEAVPEATLRALADPDDRDGDGISGRVNVVREAGTGARVVGRFGWKAEQPTVRQQSAAAFDGDLGATSSLFPDENHTRRQTACAGAPSGGRPEVEDRVLDRVAAYLRLLAVPARRARGTAGEARGAQLFDGLGCARCHRPTLETGAAPLPVLARQRIHPYTDLLLHDLGPDLADGRPVFEASGSEWRTPPLWGLGLLRTVSGHTYLLHDGRARDAAEAILWHGGEAGRAREGFRTLARADREALLAFLGTL